MSFTNPLLLLVTEATLTATQSRNLMELSGGGGDATEGDGEAGGGSDGGGATGRRAGERTGLGG